MFYPVDWLHRTHSCAHTPHTASPLTQSLGKANVVMPAGVASSDSPALLSPCVQKKKESASKTCFCVFILVLMFSRHLSLRRPSCQSLFALGAKCRLCLAAAGSRTRWNRVRKSWSSDVSQHVQFVRHLSLIPHTCSRKECQVKFTAMGKDPMERDF